jgi:hypothetical protein
MLVMEKADYSWSDQGDSDGDSRNAAGHMLVQVGKMSRLSTR